MEYSRLQLGKLELEIDLPQEGVYGVWVTKLLGRGIRKLVDNAIKYGMYG